MRHYGDITKLKGSELPPVDVIVGGSPCQNLSVAGNRKGLEGSESRLFMEQIRIIKEMREHGRNSGSDRIFPRFAVWENVVGAFSCNGGRDFQAVLTAFVRIVEPEAPDVPMPDKGWPSFGVIMGDGWSLCYRVHDAQFWGVPQRRRRISLVMDLAGGRAGEVQTLAESVLRDPETSRAKRKEAAKGTEGGAGASGGGIVCGNPWDSQSERVFYGDGTWHSLNANSSGGQSRDALLTEVLPFDTTQVTSPENGSHPKPGDPCHPLAQSAHAPTVVYCIQGNCIDRADTAGCNGKGWTEDVSYTINTVDRHAICTAFAQNQRDEVRDLRDVAGSLAAKPGMKQQTFVAYSFDSLESNSMRSSNQVSGCEWGGNTTEVHGVAYSPDCRNSAATEEKSGTLQSKNTGGCSLNYTNPVAYTMQAIGEYKETGVGSACKMRDYKDATDLVVYPDITGSLMASGYDKLGTQEATNGMHVVEKTPVCYGISSYASNAMLSPNPNSGIYEADTSRTLNLNGGNPACNQGGIMVCEPVLYDITRANDVVRECGSNSPTLHNRMGTGGNQVPLTVEPRRIVRRLTPMECERLQGFPDGWSEAGIMADGTEKQMSDSTRYKLQGNSIALPYWTFLMRRISAEFEYTPTLGSLFDGQGGFPLIWGRINGPESVLWSSEIDENAEAVVRKHFGDEDTGLKGDFYEAIQKQFARY